MVGLALAGGGVKGAAHIGAIKALEENKIKISAVAGASIGSIVAVLLAMGYTSDQMLEIFEHFSKEIFKAEPNYLVSNIKSSGRILGKGALSGEAIELAINECAKIKGISKISDIKMPISIPTVDIIDCKEYVFTNNKTEDDIKYISDISIGKAVRASCSYPAIFAPCEYKKHKFIDGGVLDNIPTAELSKLDVDKIITIKFPPDTNSNPKTIYDVAFKAIDIIFDDRDLKRVQNSDYIINITLDSSTVFNVKKIKECYNKGYIETISNIKKIKEVLNKKV